MKEKIKNYLKNFYEKKSLFWTVIGTVIFLVFGLTIFVIGAYASGWYVLEYLVSPTAIVLYFIFFFIGIPAAIVILTYLFCFKGKDRK